MKLRSILLSVLLMIISMITHAYDYQLKAKKIAKDTYVFIGALEDFTIKNGGNIVNTGFIITEDGVVVIDAGPSVFYGKQMRSVIESMTDKKLIKLIITHQHPDHFLGMQAFDDIPIYAAQETIDSLVQEGESYLDNMYRMAGDGMLHTELHLEHIKAIEASSELLGGHQLEYIQLSGHTAADLTIFDKTTGVLFTGDLVFHNRALTTPHAHPKEWLTSLRTIEELDYQVLVPGHGQISDNLFPIVQTRDYLNWIEATIKAGVNQGLDMNELLQTKIPDEFKNIALIKREFARSVSHRYPIHESMLFEEQE